MNFPLGRREKIKVLGQDDRMTGYGKKLRMTEDWGQKIEDGLQKAEDGKGEKAKKPSARGGSYSNLRLDFADF